MDEKVIMIEVPAPSSMEDKDETKKKTAGGFPLLSVRKWWARFPLPVNKYKQSRFRTLLSVQVVLGWAFIAAFCLALALGIAAAMEAAKVSIPCNQTSKFIQCPNLTPAQDAKLDSFWDGYLWSTVLEGVAATVGLLLPRRHAGVRWSLAFVAIVSAIVAHYMNARTVFGYVAANPGAIGYNVVVGGGAVLYLVLDLLGILSLLIGGPEYE